MPARTPKYAAWLTETSKRPAAERNRLFDIEQREDLHEGIAALADENEHLRTRNERLELACETFEQASAISLKDATAAETERDRLAALVAEMTALLVTIVDEEWLAGHSLGDAAVALLARIKKGT